VFICCEHFHNRIIRLIMNLFDITEKIASQLCRKFQAISPMLVAVMPPTSKDCLFSLIDNKHQHDRATLCMHLLDFQIFVSV
jgi:hypothetical protein